METLYRKVAVSERNPTKEDIYNTSRGFLSYSKVFGWVTIQNYTTPNPEYWLEEIPDPTVQLKANKSELLEALEKVLVIQDKYFGELEIHGRLRAFCFQIESLIKKHKQ